MKVDAFEAERRAVWDELDALANEARGRAERLGPARVRRLGALYREAAADLALARRRYSNEPVTHRLERLVARSRHLVYAAPTRRGSVREFFSRDYWRLVADAWLTLVASAVLLFAPAIAAGAWAIEDPGAAAGVVPEAFRPAAESERDWRDLTAGEQAAFTTSVFTNNIRVTLLAFAGGVAFAIPTVLLLLYNGLIVGAVGGLMIGAGNGLGFVELVTAHGVLELSCVVVAGAAGLRVGWSLVEPGRRTRGAAVVAEARRSVAMAIGTAPWLVLAGIIEGNRARLADLGIPVVVGVGLVFGLLYWVLVVWRGRVTGAPAASPAGTR